MNKNIRSIVLLASIGLLAGCAGVTAPTNSPIVAPTVSGVTAPATSSAVAPTAQKDAVVGWATACETYDHAEISASEALLNGVIPNTVANDTKIKTITSSITPLCTAFPANPTEATIQITEAGIELSSLIPVKTTTVTNPTVSTTSTGAK